MYKFKSQATADLIMLEPNGKRILQILGKDDAHPGSGIIQPEEMSQAVAALEAAIVAEEELHRQRTEEALAKGETPPPPPEVALRQRAAPFITMLKRCLAEDESIVWGV